MFIIITDLTLPPTRKFKVSVRSSAAHFFSCKDIIFCTSFLSMLMRNMKINMYTCPMDIIFLALFIIILVYRYFRMKEMFTFHARPINIT